MNWNPHDWMNQGGSLLACNPALAQRFIGKGLTLEPEQAVGYFNLGIGLHQQRKIYSNQGLSTLLSSSVQLSGCRPILHWNAPSRRMETRLGSLQPTFQT